MAAPSRFTLAITLLTALAAGDAFAQQFPFTGATTGDDVNVRSGAGANYYSIAQLDEGRPVTVRDNLYGWYVIDPLEDMFSYVSKAYVEAEDGGERGVIVGQRVRVRAPSPDGPDKSYRTQVLLDEGDEVRILGENGSFYKIAPPEGARLFVKKEYVEPADGEQVAAAESPAPSPASDEPDTNAQQPDESMPEETDGEPDEPAEPPVENDEPADESADEPAGDQPDDYAGEAERAANSAVAAAMPREPVEAVADRQAPPEEGEGDAPQKPGHPTLSELEARYAEESKKPLSDQPLDALRMEYEKLLSSAGLSSDDRRLVQARIEMLEFRGEVRASLGELSRTEEEMTASAQRREAEEAAKPKEYIAVGRLVASSLYDGDTLPRLYRLVDPLSGLTIAYLDLEQNNNTRQMVGRYVGIAGEREYDQALRLNVIHATHIDALEPARPQNEESAE